MRAAHYAASAGAALFLALSAHAQIGDPCSSDAGCPITDCCASTLEDLVCVASRDIANGNACFTVDGCDCESGHCDACLDDDCEGRICEECSVNADCESECCASLDDPSECVDFGALADGDACYTVDGCDCESGHCAECAVDGCDGRFCATVCSVNGDCDSNCCASVYDPSICVDDAALANGETCFTEDGCDCQSGYCVACTVNGCDGRFCAEDTSVPTPVPTPLPPVCAPETMMCGDPHMQGLRGQRIDWSGVDGGWYCLVKDDVDNLQVNVRLTAPLPKEFPDRQLITGLSVLSEGHSLVLEVTNPYGVDTSGCPSGISPCIADGGLRAIVDGDEVEDLLHFSRHEHVADGIAISASNLPVECRQFGGDVIWARMYDEMLQGERQLVVEEIFEDWILRFDHMTASDWCRQYIAHNSLADVQSNHAIFKIVTSSVTVRLHVGTNHQGNGELDWDGRVLPDLEFWQMDVGLHGLSVESESLSGILGETARPVLDQDGHEVMQGYDAFRGTVEDYRVSGSLGSNFALKNKE